MKMTWNMKMSDISNIYIVQLQSIYRHDQYIDMNQNLDIIDTLNTLNTV